MSAKGVDWSYFDSFEAISYEENGGYMPHRGEGSTMASQTATAVNMLVHKWYNDGDVYDNRYALGGWLNDISDAANWLAKNIDGARPILERIFYIKTEEEYEHILKDLADLCLDPMLIESLAEERARGSIYHCEGEFEFDNERSSDDEEDWPYSWNRKPRRSPKKRGRVSRWLSARKAAKKAKGARR